MRVILKYKKSGAASYISHLDVQRSMQRTLKRTKLPIKYTMGFHPHVVLTFAQPLSVSIESNGEYMEFSLHEYINPAKILTDINVNMPPGFCATDCGYIKDGVKSLMSTVAMCEWEITPEEKISLLELKQSCENLMKANEIIVEKFSKRGKRDMDIRSGILSLNVKEKNKKNIIVARLSSGGKLNVGPKMVLQALGMDTRYADILRVDIYFDSNSQHYPLSRLGK